MLDVHLAVVTDCRVNYSVGGGDITPKLRDSTTTLSTVWLPAYDF